MSKYGQCLLRTIAWMYASRRIAHHSLFRLYLLTGSKKFGILKHKEQLFLAVVHRLTRVRRCFVRFDIEVVCWLNYGDSGRRTGTNRKRLCYGAKLGGDAKPEGA